MAECFRLLEDGSFRLLESGGFRLLEICEDDNLAPNGNRKREYQPTYYELQQSREIERKLEETQLNLKAAEIKIETLEFKRLSDLADQAMQMELLQLLALQNQLQEQLEQLQQQRLRALQDDDDMVFLMAYLI